MPSLKPYSLAFVIGLIGTVSALVSLPSTAREVASPLAGLPRVETVSKMAGDPSLKAASGAELEVVEFGDLEAKQRILIEGGLHGNEEQASEFVLWLAHRYARGESPLNELGKGVGLDLLPYANPDGSQRQTRYNARGVNLNRNFGVLWGVTKENPGGSSFSEPETKAIRALFGLRHYAAAVDVHGYINWIVSPSSPEAVEAHGGRPTKAQATAYRAWRGVIREEMALMPGYQLKTGAGLGDGGAFEDWAYWHEGTFAYCLELETFQRFVHSYRADFNDLASAGEGQGATVDLFKRYEAFLYRTLSRALSLRGEFGAPATLAAGQ